MVEPQGHDLDEGGESSCYAHLLCLECGAVLDGNAHREGCQSSQTSDVDGDELR
jgi:hypothetical protein